MTHFLPLAALIFYLLALALLGSRGSEGPFKFRRAGVLCFTLGFFSHFFSVISFFPVADGHVLAVSMSVASLICGFLFLGVRAPKLRKFSRPVLLLVVFLYLCSSALLHISGYRVSAPRSAYLLWSHVSITLFGLISFLAAGFLALGHIWQSKALKRKDGDNRHLERILGKLPSLRELSNLSLAATKVGLFLTIIGLYLGFLYTGETGLSISPADLKLILPSLLVAFYAGILLGRSKISELMFAKLSAFGIILSLTSVVVAALH